jgi:hypothetical protein
MVPTPSRWTVAFSLCALGALLLWLTVAALSPGYVADIESRKARAKWVTEQGIEDAYRMRIDYPPGNLYLFALVGNLYRSVADPRFDRREASESQFLTWLIKVPPTLFHLATAAAVYLLVRRRQSERLAFLAAALLLFDPAALFDVAHQGQYDPVHTFFSLLAVAALTLGRPALAGAAIGLAALTKPQSWVLLPLIAAGAWEAGRLGGLARAALGGGLALTLGLLPFIASNRLHHLGRLWEYMSTNSPANQVISANAHNLWWLPTLAAGRWINDSEPLIGALSYRWAGVGLVLLVVGVSLARLRWPGQKPDLYLLAAALGAGWFLVTPRAHEYHAFFVLPFLAVAWPARPRLVGLYALASACLLLNLALHDPLLFGALAAPPDPRAPLPAWYAALTALNVGLFGLLFAGLVWALTPRAVGRVAPAWQEAAVRG